MVTCDSPGHVIFSFIGHIRFVQRAARWRQSYAAIEKDESPFKPYCSSSSGLTAVKGFEIAGVFSTETETSELPFQCPPFLDWLVSFV